MEFFNVVRKRRSVRKFEERKVPKEVIEKIVKIAMFSPSARNRRPVHLIIIDDEKTIGKIRKLREGAFSFLESAPLAIVVASESVDTWESDCAIAAFTIQLSAVDLGLGSCWGHVANRVEEEMKELLDIPKDKRVLCVIGIGYPAEEKPPHSDSEIDERRIHHGSW